MLPKLLKHGLHFIATTQHTSRMSNQVLEVVFGNVGTLIAFGPGATSAEFVSRQFGADIPSPRDLVNLPNYEM